MQIALEAKPLDQVEADALIVPVFEGAKETRFGAGDLWEAGEIGGKPLEHTLLHHVPGIRATRVLLAGAGKAEKFDSSGLRKLAGAAVRYLKSKSVKKIALALPAEHSSPDFASAAVEGAILGDFEPDRFKSDSDNSLKPVDAFTVVASLPNQAAATRLDGAVARGRILAEAQNFSRDLVNQPANHLTPAKMAEAARNMAAEFQLECEVLDQEQMEKLRMGSLLGVSMGSDEPPAFIVIRYRPSSAAANTASGAHLGLVGKGVTFDTGGISIKPADGMEKMKYDMAGGAAMIGAMRAIALLQPKINVIGIVCATENMPSGKAQKPGDVQIAMSGKSIEIINTDAEGRLVLADGLFYARQLGCTHLIDAATLTGACVVALGNVNAGAFANNDDLYERFSKALQRSGEKMWRLPLDGEYQELIRSGIADIVNSGGRWGGAVTAAMFLKEFVDETPWIHLDIAGVAWLEENKSWIAKGPSGVPVRSLVEFVRG